MCSIPNHIAVIPDGNRRYSNRCFSNSISGYKQSGESLQCLLNWSLSKGIRELSIFAWSSENWSRPQEQVDGAMKQLDKALDRWLANTQCQIAYCFVSTSPEKINASILNKMHELQLQTATSNDLTVYLYVSYGFSEDVTQMVAGRESVVPSNMSEPDLLIRTSGEQRLSNFCMHHLRYTELMFIQTLFPECDKKTWDACLKDYSNRNRRYGN